MKYFLYLILLAAEMALLTGCALFRQEPAFERFFAWDPGNTEEAFRRAAECGVTDAAVHNVKQKILAREYSIRAYAVFSPKGGNMQVMSPREEKLFAELAKGSRKAGFLKKRNYRYGGEPDRTDELLFYRIPCLADPQNMEESKKALFQLCEQFDIDGIAFDSVGYTNYHGCYCPVCQKLYAEFLKEKQLKDTPENRNRFSLDVLVRYNNTLIAFIRKRKPDLQIATHLWPVFLPEPLYGKALDFDLCGETAAWYFLWPDKKIADYTKKIASYRCGVPFVGWYDAEKYTSFDRKTPERLDHELQLILDNGGKNLMLCSLKDLTDKEKYRAVLKKYMRRAKRKDKKE